MVVDEPGDPQTMSLRTVDELFEGLDGAVTEFRTIRSVDEIPDANYDGASMDEPVESWRDPRAPSSPNLERALRLARSRLASQTRRRRAEIAREFAAWWADVVSVAVYDTADRVPVQAVRAAVGDPSLFMSDADLQYLPGRSFRDDPPVVIDALDPDRRRDQVWGAEWTDHQVPPLPPATELVGRLAVCRAPVESAAEVHQAREAVADAVDASKRLVDDPDNEALLQRSGRLTGLLVDYARGVTTVLREIWFGDR